MKKYTGSLPHRQLRNTWSRVSPAEEMITAA